MTNGAPLYNSRIIRNWIEYLKQHHPHIDTTTLLKSADIKPYELHDEGHWLTQDQINRFHNLIASMTDNPEIAREVGRFSFAASATGTIRQYLMGIIGPEQAYAVMGKLHAHFTRAAVLKTKSLGKGKIEATTTLMPNMVEKPYQCLYRLGVFEAAGKSFTGKFATVEHPVCIHKGGSHCVYIITLEKTPSFHWKQIRNYVAFVGLIACAALFHIIPVVYWDALLLSYALIVTGVTLYSLGLQKNELLARISSQGDVAGRLLEQINVSYSNAQVIQEIGQATSMILDINKLFPFIVESLEKRLDYDRGMIMLANQERTHLVYTSGYGYSPEQMDYLKGIEFHVTNPNSRGAFVVAFRKQIPFLINDIAEIEHEISQKSLDFAKKMGTHSFICVPIVFKGESLGILVVDNIRSKRILGQSDINLLMGIAPQIAISIRNAISYRSITESEERFRSLSEYAPDIIYTIDAYGAFTYVNPAWERILGHRNEEIIGHDFIQFVSGAQIPVFEGLFQKVISGREIIQDIIGTLRHKDGSDRYFSISGAPNIDPEEAVIGVVGTLKDVTDLKLSEDKLKESFDKIQSALDSTIQAISKIVESRDPYTAGHQERVARLATAIATGMDLSEDLIASIRMAAVLHDVGKINVPAEILSRPRALNRVEMGMIRMHPETGHDILASIEFPYPVAQIILQHHEKMDGSGYPAGLKGDQILLEARILAVADVVEAMATHRPYRPSLGIEKTLEEISQQKGKLYDEDVVNTCLKLFAENAFTL